MPWVFLAVCLVGAWFTFNAYLPQRRTGPLVFPSFFAGWLTSELPVHHVAWQLAATALFIWAGALTAWPGWLGLAIALASWVGLLAMVPISRRSEPAMERALREGLGSDYREEIARPVAERRESPSARLRLAIPLLLFDRDVAVERDIQYAPGFGRRHQLDVYRPKSAVRGAPVLLQIHGGGWVIGDKREQARPLMTHLAARGWVCVAANYRLCPRATFPEPLVDVKLAIRWIRQHVAEFGGDPDFLALTGGSAGGHLSSLAALTANDPEYQPGFEEVDTAVQACVPFYGVYDLTNRFGHQHRDGIRRFAERVLVKRRFREDPEAFERASPLFRVHADAPPFLVIHGGIDSLAPVGEARGFAEALRKTSRAPLVYAEIPGAQHAFEVFHSPRTARVVRGVDRFLASVRARLDAG